jgi:hypothetical protein
MPEITLEEIEAFGERREARQYLPDDKLGRVDAAEVLTALGYPMSYDTLAALKLRRKGPPCYKFGGKVFYKYGELITWAENRVRRVA